MIQIQIASELTPRGLDGVRWVLVDGTRQTTVDPLVGRARDHAVPAAVSPQGFAQLQVYKALVALLALILAWVLAHQWLRPNVVATAPQAADANHSIPWKAPASGPVVVEKKIKRQPT